MKVDVKLSGVEGILKTLQSLPPEVVSKRGGPVKLALKKGAMVIREEAAKNIAKMIFQGDDENEKQSTGLLERNIIVSRGKAPAGGNGERYLVRVKKVAYDGQKIKRRGSIGRRVTTLKTAHLLEYGSQHQPARPWLRPAFASKKQEAMNTVIEDLNKRVNRIVRRLARQNAKRK